MRPSVVDTGSSLMETTVSRQEVLETIESLIRLGYLELTVGLDSEPGMLPFRDAVIGELKERFGVRGIAQAPPTYDSASAGMVGQGECANLGDCDPCSGVAWFTASQRAFRRASHPRAMPAAWREKILYLEASKKKVQITDKFLDGVFLGIIEGCEEFGVGTLCWLCGVQNCRNTAS